MTFTSTAVAFGGAEGTITGELTIKGIPRTVEFATEFNVVVVDAFGVTGAGFSAEASISRKHFDITWNAAIEAGGVLVSDKVVKHLDVAFTAPQSDPQDTVEGQEALCEGTWTPPGTAPGHQRWPAPAPPLPTGTTDSDRSSGATLCLRLEVQLLIQRLLLEHASRPPQRRSLLRSAHPVTVDTAN